MVWRREVFDDDGGEARGWDGMESEVEERCVGDGRLIVLV